MPSWACEVLGWVLQNRLVLCLDLILTMLIVYPLWHYVVYGWNRKWEEFEDTLSDEAKLLYMNSFRNLKYEMDKDVGFKFKKLYQGDYGRHWFTVPIILLLLIACLENFVIASDLIRLVWAALAKTPTQRIDDLEPKFYIAPAAVAGAYTFVVYDIVRRVQKRNLLPVDVKRSALRLAIAIPIGYAFATLNLVIGPFLAFAIGAFPLSELLTVMRQIANERLKLKIGPSPVGSRVIQLPGVDPDTADRLEDADVTTIQQLSVCDPVDLAARTNLNFRYVVNMCSQSLAWIYLAASGEGPAKHLDALRPLGLAGALEIRKLMSDLTDRSSEQRREARDVLSAAARATKLPVNGLRYAFKRIVSARNTEFLHKALG